MNSNPYIVSDSLLAIRLKLISHEIDGAYLSAEEIREINELLRVMGQCARKQANELVRLRHEARLRQPRAISPKPTNVVAFPHIPRPQPPRGGAA